jgi:ABC-2 type transport system ATP-binding protein
MRLIFPTAGSARILNRDIGDAAMHARIGYLPENPYFYDYLTAREFLNYCGELFGLDRRTREGRTSELLTRVNLETKSWDRQLRKLSKGMLQRVGLAQALVNDPEIVFLDEPMSGLDPIGRREVRDLIASLRTQGKTVFMCSHILSDIEVLCDNVAILKRGRLAHSGSLAELRAGESTMVEIIATGADVDVLKDRLRQGVTVTTTASGLRIEVANEKEVDEVLTALRQAQGKLVSVQPVRQSLEELFLDR